MHTYAAAVLFSLSALGSVVPLPESVQPHVIVLGYHDILARDGQVIADDGSRTVTLAQFREQLDLLAAHHYSVIPIEELSAFVRGARATLPERSAVITIDDGWASTGSAAAAELRKRGYPFTAFVYTRTADRHASHPYNLSWEDIASLSAEDGVDVESHTYSHPLLGRKHHETMTEEEYRTWLDTELKKSREELAKKTGREVRFLAYPYGDFDEQVKEAVREAGYQAAFTVKPLPVTRGTDPYAIGRYIVLRDTTRETFTAWLESATAPSAPSDTTAAAK